MKVAILAGGLGTRISEESHLRPKPMIEIGDMPILWHIMKYYAHFGLNDFIICCGYKASVIKEFFANYFLHGSDVTFDFADGGNMTVHSNISEPWKVTLVDTGLHTQTGGRIKRIAKYTAGEPFMMTYGDGLGTVDLRALAETHKASGRMATLTAVQPGSRYGVLDIDEDSGRVMSFREKAKQDSDWINGGFMVLEPGVFDYIEGDDMPFEAAPLRRLSAAGQLGMYRHAGFWQCMDTQRDKAILEQLWAEGQAPWKVWG